MTGKPDCCASSTEAPCVHRHAGCKQRHGTHKGLN